MITMTLDDVWDYIDEANLIADIATRKNAIEVAIQNLRALLDSGDTRAWYAIGYAYYCHPDRQTEGSIEALETVNNLTSAIDNNVEVSLSHLYLSFHFFDIQDFALARTHADMVDKDTLDEVMAVRCSELQLCILIRMNGIDRSALAMHHFAEYVQAFRSPFVPPLVLMNTIEDELETEPISNAVSEALRNLDLAYPVLGEDGFSRLVLGEDGFSRLARK